MPLYEYRCPGCEHRFEVLQQIGAGSEGLTCPQCGAEEPDKLLSTFAGRCDSSFGSAGVPAASAGSCGSGFG